MLADQDLRRLPKIPRYCRTDDIENVPYESSLKFIPIPIHIRIDPEQDEEEDEETDEESTVNSAAQLDKWDKGARSWLSAGTMFLLIILFHVIQVRSDLRRFTAAANIQIDEVCGVLEDKTESLQSALSLAAIDIGPITLKFVRDLKTKLRSAIHFAGQIFGGRVRAFLMSLLSYRYCILVGIVVILKSLADKIAPLFFQPESDSNNNNNPSAGTSFIESVLGAVRSLADSITEFLTNPEALFSELLNGLLDVVFDPDLLVIGIPEIVYDSSQSICSKLKRLDFEDINLLVQSYITKLIIVLAIVLVLYNAFQFVTIVESEPEEHVSRVKDRTDKSDEYSSDSDEENEEDEAQPSSVSNASTWLYNFLSYEPFWIFLTMGIFGLLHAYFSRSLYRKAQIIKKSVIDPQIDSISDEFTKEITTFLVKLEESWRNAFKDIIRPITIFIEALLGKFEPAINAIGEYGGKIVNLINHVLEYLNRITPIKNGIKAALDCLFLNKLNSFLNIADLLRRKLFANDWTNFNGGIVHLLKNSIKAIFKKIKMTKILKKMISVSFLLFLRLVAKRSIFLYVYLIVCLILISQGFIMIIIKLILGYL